MFNSFRKRPALQALFFLPALICLVVYGAFDLSFSQQLLVSRIWLGLFVGGMAVMVTANGSLQHYFKEEDGPYLLATFRIIYFGLLTVAMATGIYPPSTAHGIEQVHLPFASEWLNLVPDTPTTNLVIKILLISSGTLAAIGLFTRPAILVLCAVGLFAFGEPQLYGKVVHNHNILWFAIILGLSPCGHVFSLDACLQTKRGDDLTPYKSVKYALPIRLIWILMGIIYFFPGFWKIWASGLDWAFTENLRYQILSKWAKLESDLKPMIHIENYPILYKGGALFAILFELGFLFIILQKKLRKAALFLGLLFHLSIYLTLHIQFLQMVFAYITLINFDRIFAKGELRSKASKYPYQKPVMLAGVLLIGFSILFGAAKIHSWPFTVYPTFDHIESPYYKQLEFYGRNKQQETVLLDTDTPIDQWRPWNYSAWMLRAIDDHQLGNTDEFEEKVKQMIGLFTEEQTKGIVSIDVYLVTKSLNPADTATDKQLLMTVPLSELHRH